MPSSNSPFHQSEVQMNQEKSNELEELSALLDDYDEPLEPSKPIKCLSPPGKSAVNTNKLKPLRDINIFEKENEPLDASVTKLPSLSQLFKKSKELINHNKSEIHDGDTDSSDDEDKKYTSEQKYTESGRTIKNLIKKQNSTTVTNLITNSTSWKSKTTLFSPSGITPPPRLSDARDIYTDPYFGLRIITPLISSSVLHERMQGKIAVSFTRLPSYISDTEKKSDWVIAGVIVSKFIKTSQKGKQYVSWILSDLKEGLRTVSIFLFGKAYQKLWKTNTHIVVAILNPNPLDNNKTSKDIAALSVSNPDQVMIWGQSKDLGTCKARKKNGEPCTAIVNMNQCDYCIYHVKQEYRKFTARSELQAPTGGSLNQLKNKVLGKNEVFYAGRVYTANVAKPAKKQIAKDQKRLSQLFNQCENRFGSPGESTKPVVPAPSARVQLMKDAERLQKLTGSPATLTSLALEDKNIVKQEFNSKLSTSAKDVGSKKGNKVQPTVKTSVGKRGPDPECVGFSETKTVNHESNNVKKVENSFSKTRTKSIPINKVSTIESSNSISLNKKKQPTKNRFENLTKISTICKRGESESSCSGRQKTTTKTRCPSDPQAGIEICFEFDEDNTSKSLNTFDLDSLKNSCHNSLSKKSDLSSRSNSKLCNDTFTRNRRSYTNQHLDVEFDGDQKLGQSFIRSNGENYNKKSENTHASSTSFNKLTSVVCDGNNKPSNVECSDKLTLDINHIGIEGKTFESVTKQPVNSEILKKPHTPIHQSTMEWSDDLLESKNPNQLQNGSVKSATKLSVNSQFSDKLSGSNSVGKTLTDTQPTPEHRNELSTSISPACRSSSSRLPQRQSAAKLKALQYVQKKGPILKKDPNDKKIEAKNSLEKQGKRKRIEEDEVSKADKSTLSKRFLDLMNATSKHLDLIDDAETREIDEYYEKMEKKEKMEEKMMNTYKVDCKAVRCLKCNYKWFSASEQCKADKHPIKVISAVKRFFQCQNCKRRTVSLDIIPMHNCFGCGSSSWIRAPMMKERKSATVQLSIRGGEQKFTNSVVTDANLDLLVPDDNP